MRNPTIITTTLLLTVVCFAAAAQAGPGVPITYGVGDSIFSAPTQLSFASTNGAHWEIQDSMGRPLYLYHNAGSGPLQKSLTGADMAADQYTLTEHLYIEHGAAWTDWHEQFVSPAAVWIGTPTLSIDETGDVFEGLISGDGRAVDFYFAAPIPAGMTLTINKQFNFADGAPTKEIVIDQWPTVPEPGTFALLAVALAGSLAYAWRKRK